jgi:hypothetical protein
MHDNADAQYVRVRVHVVLDNMLPSVRRKNSPSFCMGYLLDVCTVCMHHKVSAGEMGFLHALRIVTKNDFF